MPQKICIGLSGGVDSSVAALLLKRQGYDVFAMFMQNWHDADSTLHGDCEWEEDRFVAEMVARKIGIPFYFIDLSRQYRQRVVDYMFDEYAKGRTPNPDVLCNREIKFDAFLQAAEKLGADCVATGHYCRKEAVHDADGQPVMGADGEVLYRLMAGTDPGKDQSYFLCQLSQEQLRKAVFPIGDMLKKDVRALAREAGLPSADKKDSQGICFVGKVDLPTFLKQKLESREGRVIEVFDAYYGQDRQYDYICRTLSSLTADGKEAAMISSYISEDKCSETTASNSFNAAKIAALSDDELLRLSQPVKYDIRSGRIIGTHEGAQFFTIGQRKGLGIGGHKDSLFVIDTDIEGNVIYVGEGHRHKGLSRSCLRIAPDEVHWLRPDLALKAGELRRSEVRIRYRQPLQKATLISRENGLYILFDSPQRGITKGQFAAWYETDGELTGSGPIS